MNRILARKINRMARVDQAMRKSQKKGATWNAAIDRNNTLELKKLVKRYGWPTISLVGKRASFNAWLLVQHADHDHKFQKQVLDLLTKIDRVTHDVNRANIAYLTDRVLVNSKKRQKFGTQFRTTKNGGLKLRPLKSPGTVDRSRKEYGLPPLAVYVKMAEEFNSKIK